MDAIGSATVTVSIQTGNMYANEITWDIDGEQEFPLTPYENEHLYEDSITLPEGQHVFYFYDSYGDGWSGDSSLSGVVTSNIHDLSGR